MVMPRVPEPLRKSTSCRCCFSALCVVGIAFRDLSGVGRSRYRSTIDLNRDGMRLPNFYD